MQNVIDRKPYPEDEDLVEVKFATTPIMSTYLVAFVIGEYDHVESQSSDGVTVRVYTPVGKAEQGKFALEVSMLVKFYFFLLTRLDIKLTDHRSVDTLCPDTNTNVVIIFLSMQVATKTLPFYKDYFSVPYPLPKIDLIAIADFAAGA